MLSFVLLRFQNRLFWFSLRRGVTSNDISDQCLLLFHEIHAFERVQCDLFSYDIKLTQAQRSVKIREERLWSKDKFKFNFLLPTRREREIRSVRFVVRIFVFGIFATEKEGDRNNLKTGLFKL